MLWRGCYTVRMAQLILFEDAKVENFLPLVYWRGLCELRCGRKTLIDNTAWELAKPVTGLWTRDWISKLSAVRCQTPVNKRAVDGTLLVNARWLVKEGVQFNPAPFVATCNGSIVYIACGGELTDAVTPEVLLDPVASQKLIENHPSGEVEADLLEYPWDLVKRNEEMLNHHWNYDDRAIDGYVSHSAFMINTDYIHVSERTEIRPTAVINAEKGPVYISNDVLVDVHTYIEGPAYIGPGCVVKPHSTVRDGATLGSLCLVGGEINNCILAGYANKGHEGFLGQAYVGSWVNLGAGTTNSTVKTTYGSINIQLGKKLVETEEQFFGSVIGDFARLGIGQLLPTGSVVGFGAMVANGGMAPKYTPSFEWLTADCEEKTDSSRLLQTFERVMARRRVEMIPQERELFGRLPEIAERYGV